MNVRRTHFGRIYARAVFAMLLALALAAVGPAARPTNAVGLPAVITITKTQIENVDGNGCSLYEALQATFNGAPYHQCNAGPDANAILFAGAAAGGTITMPTGPGSLDLPMINKNVTITGPVTISGGGAQGDLHIFRIAPDGTLNLVSLTLKDAHTSGGGAAILDNNFGTINAIGVSFENNVADGDGGAINSNGTVNIAGSNFAGNKALGVANGGNNPATGYGGAIRIDGSSQLKLALTNFSGNIADKGAGAVYAGSSSADISDAIFSGNIVDGTGTNSTAPQGGGAILNDSNAQLNMVRTAFNGNLAPTGSGGAILNKISATSTISETSFNGNIAGSPGNSAQGGAIYNPGGTLDMSQATFLNNAVAVGDGGAIANDRHGSVTLANSSFTANAALQGNGGALNNTNTQLGGPASTVEARNVTFSSNSAQNNGNLGGAIFNVQGHSVTLGNTIVDNSGGDNCTGAITSLGHNLDSANTCGFDQAGDKHDQNPLLDAPFFNGGPLPSLLTQKLKAGSPAIDAGDPAICAAAPVNNVDQRSEQRPKNGDNQGGAICDIGAFESDALVPGYGSTPVSPGQIDFGSAVINIGTANALLNIFETGNATLQVSNPQIGGANAADFSITAPSPFPLSIADGGIDRDVGLTCAPKAAGVRSATLTLTTNDPAHSQVSYPLVCTGTTVPKPAFGSLPAAPGPIDLGSTIVNTPVSAGFVISSTGDADLHVGAGSPLLGGANPGDFTLQTSLPPALAPGAQQSLQVQCKPTALGIRTASLNFTTDDPARPTVSFNLACGGDPAPPPPLAAPGQSVGNTPSKGLGGAYGVAISPDGKNIYVTGYTDKAVAVFARDPASGALTAIQKFTNVALNSLNGARLISVSPDGKHVYVVSELGGLGGTGALVAFNRSLANGTLSVVEELTSGGEAGLIGAYGVVVSADGQFIYVTGSNGASGSVVVFSRNINNGFVNHVDTITDPELSGAHGLALSPDGTNLYVTAYASPNASTGKLIVYKRSPIDGKLSHVQTRTECDTLACIFGGGFIDGLGGAFQVVVSPDGQYVYAAGTYDGAVVVFRRNGLDGSLSRVRTYKDNTGGVNGLDGVSGIAISPDGKYLFATGYNDKAIAVFQRDASTGLLTFVQIIQRSPLVGGPAQPLLDGARDLRVTPDGTSVYAAAFVDNAVVGLHTANLVPALTSLAPSSAPAGGAAFTLTVDGEGFIPGSAIYWNGVALPTTLVNNTKLSATITADKLGAAGQASVSVINPAPGGGSSNLLKFTITAPGQNPVPSVVGLTPASAPAGGASFPLTVNGSNFIAGSKVHWNGADRPTTYVSASQLTAQIGPADIAAGGPAGVLVFNPGPGGGLSNAAEFTIASPGENPTPSIGSINPTETLTDLATAQQLTLTINGNNFIADSQAQWNGANRPTTYINNHQLKMTVSVADLAIGGQGSITVVNPGPGGGKSNTATFTIHTIKSRLYLPMVRK